MEKGDVSLGEMDIRAQNRKEISRALHNHRFADVSTYIGVNVNVLDVLERKPSYTIFPNPVNCEI